MVDGFVLYHTYCLNPIRFVIIEIGCKGVVFCRGPQSLFMWIIRGGLKKSHDDGMKSITHVWYFS